MSKSREDQSHVTCCMRNAQHGMAAKKGVYIYIYIDIYIYIHIYAIGNRANSARCCSFDSHTSPVQCRKKQLAAAAQHDANADVSTHPTKLPHCSGEGRADAHTFKMLHGAT